MSRQSELESLARLLGELEKFVAKSATTNSVEHQDDVLYLTHAILQDVVSGLSHYEEAGDGRVQYFLDASRMHNCKEELGRWGDQLSPR